MPAIPPAWLDQAAPGAVILTDVHGPLGGTLVRLTVDEHGTATGRFLAHWAGFMTMRHDVEPTEPRWPVLELPATQSWTTIDPLTANTHGLFGFILLAWPLSRPRSTKPLGQDVTQRLGALLPKNDHAFTRHMGIERN